MKRAVTAEQMRALEREAEERWGISTALLMENAGASLAQEALRVAGSQGRFLIFCGRGNNGGDGLVAARKLHQAGREVRVEVVGDLDALTGEPKRNLEALRAMNVRLSTLQPELPVMPGDVVIDALLGTGINRPPDGPYADAIRRILAYRTRGARAVAADVPSGLHSDSGRPFTPCVQADVTVAFGFAKVGHLLEPGASFCGELRVVDIGLPPELEPDGPLVALVEESDARYTLPRRRPDGHKGTYGHVLVVAGSTGKTGAGALAGMGALRSGAGLVTIGSRPDALPSIQAFAPELMGVPIGVYGPYGRGDLDALLSAAAGKSAVVVGPGIPRGEQTGALLRSFLAELEVPCVIDADGLNAIADEPEATRRARGQIVLTPHPGEAARLLGRSTADIVADRLSAARELAQSRNAIVVLKGARSLIALPDGAVWVSPTGNPGMGTGGTGDVLAGLCGALLGQGLEPTAAVVTAVYAHGLAADLMVDDTGQLGLVASDLLQGLTRVWTRWNR